MAKDLFTLSAGRDTPIHPPRDWGMFERLIRDLYGRLLGDIHTDLNGRSGQPQAGVDVVGIDCRNRERVGIQCKGRGEANFGRGRGLTEKELRDEAEKAKAFVPPLQRFVVLTTGPNDERLHQVARELTEVHRHEGLFSVDFHGWDWVEARLHDHIDLAVGYRLMAVAQSRADNISVSPIAREIGTRFERAVELMNVGREGGDRFTLQGLASYAGHKDWRRLEQIVDGTADADEAELTELADTIGLNLEWLLEGKGAPFCTDNDIYRSEVEETYSHVMAQNPDRIVFVRQREGGDGYHDVFIVVKRDEVRWEVLRNTHPGSGKVGGTGAWQLFDLCRLLRKFDYADVGARIDCHGMHLDSPVFEQLLEGEIYPGSVLRYPRNDHWWQAFSALRQDWVTGNAPYQTSLRDAISITRHQLGRARGAARPGERWADSLAWGRFSLAGPEDGVELWA